MINQCFSQKIYENWVKGVFRRANEKQKEYQGQVCLSAAKLKRRFEFLVIDCCAYIIYCIVAKDCDKSHSRLYQMDILLCQ